MYLNNKGSTLATTLIIFSIIITIVMTCIGLNYTNSNIFILELKESNMKQVGYGAIDIAHANILKQVENAVKNTSNKNQFQNYISGIEFRNYIKDLSKSDLKNVYLTVSNKVNVNNDGSLDFNIVSNVKDGKYIKKFQATVKIKNPFLENDESKEIEELTFDLINENEISKIVKVYDYKEIVI